MTRQIVESKRIIIFGPDKNSSLSLSQSLKTLEGKDSHFKIEQLLYPFHDNISSHGEERERVHDQLHIPIHKIEALAEILQRTDPRFIFFIILLKDPIARTISDLSVNIDTYLQINKKLLNDDGGLQSGALRKLFYEYLIETGQSIHEWYTYHIESFIGKKFSELNFDKTKQFGITNTSAGKVLLLKYEALNENFTDSINEFFELHSLNQSSLTYSEIKRTFRIQTEKSLKLPATIVGKIYSLPEVVSIYSEDEIATLKHKWISNNIDEEYQEFWRVQLAESQFTEKHSSSIDPKFIIIAGLPRSGSTLVFNIVLQILEHTSSSGSNLGYIDPSEVERFLELYRKKPISCLIKVHEWNPLFKEYLEKQALVIFSFRDLRDSSASAIQKEFIHDDDKQIINFVKKSMMMSQYWERANNLLKIKYEDATSDVVGLINNISNFIGIKLSPETIDTIANNVDYQATFKASQETDHMVCVNRGRTVFNARTQLHRNHLAGGAVGKYSTIFFQKQIKEIEKVSFDWLKSHGYESTVFQPDPFTPYFSENGDDFLLWHFFNFKHDGFYVDIGAFDGIYLSNSYSFYSKGWKGICVEANPYYAELLAKNCSTNINIHAVLVEENTTESVDFFCDQSGFFSSLSENRTALELGYSDYYQGSEKIKRMLPADTLNNVLQINTPEGQIIDFLSLDVAGSELKVLKGLDFSQFRPKVFVTYAFGPSIEQLKHFMASKGYALAITLGNNLYFTLTKEDASKLQGIQVNCTIEKQVHPKGYLFSFKDYYHGVQFINGEKATTVVDDLENRSNHLAKKINNKDIEVTKVSKETNSQIPILKNKISQSYDKLTEDYLDAKDRLKELQEKLDQLTKKFLQENKNLSNSLIRASVCLEKLQEEKGINLPMDTASLLIPESLIDISDKPNASSKDVRNSNLTIPPHSNVILLPWRYRPRKHDAGKSIPLAEFGDPVTVVVPNFNKGNLIRKCIESLQCQTYSHLEILIIDDASTDESINIARDFAAKDNRIKLIINESNKGVSFTRDKGIRLASAQLISTLDSDDFYSDDKKIEREVRLLSDIGQKTQYPVITFSKMAFYNAMGEKQNDDKREIVEGDIFSSILCRNRYIPHHFLFYKKMYEQIGGLDLEIPIYEDWDLKIRLSRDFEFYCTGHEGYAYVNPGTGLSGAEKATHSNWIEKIFRKNHDLIKDEEYCYIFKNFSQYYSKAFKGKPPNIRRRPRLYLHIGASKTGTTSIQNMSERNCKLIENSGFLWLDRMTAFGIASTVAKDMGYTKHLSKKWLPVVDIPHEIEKIWHGCLEKNLGGTIVSSEYFWDSFGFFYEDFLDTDIYFKFMGKVLSYFYNFDVKIIIYLRRQDKHLESVIREYIKSIGPFDKELIYRSFKPSYMYRNRISLLESLVGVGNVIAKGFERSQVRDAVTDFYNTIGVRYDAQSFKPLKGNEHNPRVHRDILEYINILRMNWSGNQNDFQKKHARSLLKVSTELKNTVDFPYVSPQEAFSIATEFSEQNNLIVNENELSLFFDDLPDPSLDHISYTGFNNEKRQQIEALKRKAEGV